MMLHYAEEDCMAIGVINRRKSYYDITANKMIDLTEE